MGGVCYSIAGQVALRQPVSLLAELPCTVNGERFPIVSHLCSRGERLSTLQMTSAADGLCLRPGSMGAWANPTARRAAAPGNAVLNCRD